MKMIGNMIALAMLGIVSMGCEKEEQMTEPMALSEVKRYGTDPTSCEIIEFDEQEYSTGGTIAMAYSQGTPVGVSAQRRLPNGTYRTENVARLFDTSSPSGALQDFRTPNNNAMRPMGNILLVNQAEAGETNFYGEGGRIEMDFSAMGSITLKGIHVLDIEEDEAGSTLALYSQSGQLIKTMPLPVTGGNGATRLRIDTPGVHKLVVTFTGKKKKSGDGAIDVIEFCRD
ncbi:hypothetical protein [Pontibacter roseus]|uniref:hypothetical protein n=1 Tax=Pontibacter roseus TaxID=336989 RepID=UPI00037AD8DE|nr:hypothetical protein [Pontibacter roseus]